MGRDGRGGPSRADEGRKRRGGKGKGNERWEERKRSELKAEGGGGKRKGTWNRWGDGRVVQNKSL